MGDQGNAVVTQIIDSSATTQQYATLLKQVETLDSAFLQLTKDIIGFSNAAGSAKGTADFNKQAAAAQTAAEKLIQTQNQTQISIAKLASEQQKLTDAKTKAAIADNRLAISANQLAASNARVQSAQEKATAATQKALSPYQQLSKELDKQRLAAKDLGLQYGLASPQFKKAQDGVLKLDNQLKTLDKSLGQNQRNVGNYEESIKGALGSLYGAIDRAIPGAGQLTRTVVEGFQKITSEAGISGKAITGAFNTPGGFGFKPQGNNDAPSQITNTGETIANTEATAANTEANIANAESEKVKAGATSESTEASIANSVATTEGTSALGLLAGGLATFSTLAFVAAIGSATYYLSQFKSTGNDVEKFLGGLKNQIANIGGNIVNGAKNFSPKTLLNAIPVVAAYNLFKGTQDSFSQGVDNTQSQIDLKNADETSQAFQGQTQAEADNKRIQAKDPVLEIKERQKLIKEAQADEEQVLQSQKENADLTIQTAITLGNKYNKLTTDQISFLKKGDLTLAQDLAENGQTFTTEGYELYKQGIQKKIAYQQGATNQLAKLQDDADKMQLRADNELAKAQDRLDKARVQSALDASKLILDDADQSGKNKLKANADYVKASIALIKIERQNELDSAGIGSTRGGKDNAVEAKKREAIEVETQNAINKVRAEGMKNETSIQKNINAEVTKDYETRRQIAINGEKSLLEVYKNAENASLLLLDTRYSRGASLLAKKYQDGIIDENEYNVRIIALQKDAEAQKLQIQIDSAKKSVNTQAVGVAYGTTDPKELQASADQLVKLQNQASDLATKNEIDNIHKVEAARKEAAGLEKQIASESLDLLKSVVDGGYQAQIDALKKKGEQLDITAAAERDAIQNSLTSDKQKAAQERILNAQTANQKATLLASENKIKTKQAEFDKAINVAQIIESTGAAEVSALKYLADPVTAILYPEIAALIGVLGALQLTKVLATPIPKYKSGTDFHRGGLGIVGDGGMPELVKYPDGHSFLSPATPTLMDMPKGTTVIPGLETMQHLAKIQGFDGKQIDLREVAQLLKINNKYQKKIAEKPIAQLRRNDTSSLIAMQQIAERRRNYFK